MKKHVLLYVTILISILGSAQEYWHGVERTARYHPEGQDIVIINGHRRFNRALYGANTGFRAEAGDLPEFALYLPGMGGNLKFGLIRGGTSKWLIQAASIKSIYRAGSMLYEIKDPMLDNGIIQLQLIVSYERESLLVKLSSSNLPNDLYIIPVFGGVSGKKFSRDGDIGADPESSFDLKTEYCRGNSIQSTDDVSIRATNGNRVVHIQTYPQLTFNLGNADAQLSPLMLISSKLDTAQPLVFSRLQLNHEQYISLDADESTMSSLSLKNQLEKSESFRQALASKVRIQTPDPYINAMAAPLSIAADAIWESPSYMHGAIAWRMRLNGWRGGYIADVLGWHDRARTMLDSYLGVQIKEPPVWKVEMDTALNLARHREVLGNSLFGSGYISREPNSRIRPHHYDMNLVFIDQLLNHLNWTGDTAYIRKVWDALVIHLNWEKRNFDSDNDGLYDAYAAIWASDALQYSGGAVTHSTAYNYRANLKMIELGSIIGKDIKPFKVETEKILAAVNKQLWLTNKGWYAEFKDALGQKLVHDQPGLWTIYHAIDEGLADPYQAWQSLRYIDQHIPHIPMRIKGFSDTSLYTLSTTNWQPYTWSLNNVALSELMHTALAYWQGQRNEEAYKIFRSSILESMYFGASPGNIQQLTFYDAMRGELYRDFADAIGATGRSLIEGLFGIQTNLIKNQIIIRPGFPISWDSAFLSTSDITFSFQRNDLIDHYVVKQSFNKKILLRLQIPFRNMFVNKVLVNGMVVKWKMIKEAISQPYIEIQTLSSNIDSVDIYWNGERRKSLFTELKLKEGEQFNWRADSKIIQVKDPQNAIKDLDIKDSQLSAKISKHGVVTLFVQLSLNNISWWQPLNLIVDKSNPKTFVFNKTPVGIQERLDLNSFFNARVTDIFKNKYQSPRPTSPTLQLPLQGIGNWAYPLIEPLISDSGWRRKSGHSGMITLKNGLSFNCVSDISNKNILFVSNWDNYPDSISIPLDGKASFIHLLMTGSTNPMQSRIINGLVEVEYTDSTLDSLELRNPENWWPIEQDYYTDGYAFTTDALKPIRISLKTGEEISTHFNYNAIKGFSSFGIEHGAVTVLGLPVNPQKVLKKISIKAIANDVLIGLMGITIER